MILALINVDWLMAGSLEAQVQELQRWRQELSDVSSPSGMLLQIAAAMKREEDFWRSQLEDSRVQLHEAEQAFAAKFGKLPPE